ncbi:phage antirepressor N-terminal domain-containing protein [Providencia sp. PROV214]|uniref:phage antirepressor N-terminal domain-containing protein n=1 Tax=Providencia sp. PROV214 TaxID=2949910 RepID=UPI00234BD79F|nr:phage antirepressor N-terminal domain-containing protein [Providencia sp. PROV214]
MNTISTINVPFHGDNLYVVNYNGEPHVPMKPIVEGMGLDWKSQFSKIKSRFSKGMVEITIPTKGGEQSMICLALRKLAGWLHTISPNKVKPEIRDKVIQYQEECDDVLYEYWTTGEVKAKQKSTVQERNPLKNAVNLLVSKKGIMYPEAYSLVHQQFNVSGIDELTADQIPMAVEYVHKLVMEGEYIPKQQLPQVGLESLAMPMSFFDDYDWLFELEGTDKDEALSSFYKYPQKMLKNMTEYPNPLGKMLTKLSDAGVNVDAAWLYLNAIKHNYEVNTRKLNSAMSASELSRLLVVRNRFDKALSLWKDNLCRNLIRMDVPSALPFNQAITDALSELRIITDKISERLIA